MKNSIVAPVASNFKLSRMLETALPRQNYQKILLQGSCNTKLNYLKLTAINGTVQSLLLNIMKIEVLISDLLLFMFQFHIAFAKLWIWENAVFTCTID